LENFFIRCHLNQPTNITSIDAWSDPESQIRFLEDTLHGKDWRVRIEYDADAKQAMQSARTLYEQRGYLVRNLPNGLELHHLGNGTKAMSVLNEAGTIGGLGKLASKPSIVIKELSGRVGHVVKWLDDSMHDPARANGVINMVSEYFLWKAGSSAQKSKTGVVTHEGNWRSPKNLLQSISGLLFLGQSLIYAFAAKSNDDVAIGHLQEKLDTSRQHGRDITDLRFDPATDKEIPSAWNSFTKFLGKYPVQIGAVLNDLGMISYMGHAFAQRKWEQNIVAGKADPSVDMTDPDRLKTAQNYTTGKFTGFMKDIAGACTSIVAWALLLLPRKPIDDATRKNHAGNVFASTWDAFRENPQGLSGAMTLASSSLRLMGAKDKYNTNQIIGETIYIGGDIALMFTHNDAYGGEKTKDISALARKIAVYVNELPVVFGQESQKQFVHGIAEYLKQKSLEELGGKPEKIKLTMAEMNERADHLARAVMKKIGARDRLDHLTDKIAELANYFPLAQQSAVESALIETLSQLPWVKASAAEIRSTMDASPFIGRTHHTPALAPSEMAALSKPVAELLATVKGIDMGGSAAAIQRALKPFVGQQQATPTLAIHLAKPETMIHGPAMNDRHAPLALEAAR